VSVAIGVDGRGYLEKVVQVGFDVPAPDAAELGQLLVDGINKAIEAKSVEARFNSERWRDLYSRGLLPYLTTPRRVTRFTAMAEFGLARYIDGDECNIDPVDFIGIEALREFEPNVYEALRNSKDAVTGMTSGDVHFHREKAEAVGPLLAVAGASKQGKAAEQLLPNLFPAIEWAVSDVGQGIDRDQQLEERRVAHERTFDRYFQFTVPTKDLSDGEVTRTVALASGSKDDLVAALRKLIATGHMVVFLVRLQGAPEKVPAGVEATFMAALFDVGDALPNRVETLLDISELLLADGLVESLLERRPAAERAALFREAMDASTGIVLPIEVVRLQMHRHERERSPAIAQSDLEQLLTELIGRVVAEAKSGDLLNHRHLAPLLYAWDEVEPCAPRSWAEEQADQRAGLVRLIAAFDRISPEDGQRALVVVPSSVVYRREAGGRLPMPVCGLA
jgi:predicted KAP-like P-loop ATPase